MASDGVTLSLVFDGSVTVDEVVAAVLALDEADPEAETRAMVVDSSAVHDWAIELEELHRIATVIASRFSRGPEYRFAVFGSTAGIESLVMDYVGIRDFAAAPRPGPRAQLQLFDSLVDATAWAREAADEG